MAPPMDPKHQNEIITSAKSHSLKAAIFHTMAFKLSLETNKNEIALYLSIIPQSPLQCGPNWSQTYSF